MYLLGYDIGGTKCAAVLGKTDGDSIELLGRMEFPTSMESGPESIISRLEICARRLLAGEELSTSKVSAVGISCGGPLDSARGIILGPPNLPGWDYVPVTELVEADLGIPVGLENDANSCALAEWRWGAGRGCRNMVFLTFGTGLGAGIILNGSLYTGSSGLAGEVGHIRLAEDGPVGYGKAGSFEGFCSGGGIARLAGDVLSECLAKGKTVAWCKNEQQVKDLNARVIADAARDGDPIALEVFETVSRCLGRGLAILIDVLNPELIVIGSIFARQKDLLWPIAEQVLREEALPASLAVCRVVPAALEEAIGDYASLSVAAARAGRN